MSDDPATLSTAISRAEAVLAHADHPRFSESAFARLKERLSLYIGELVNESLAVARRHGADTVSAPHVDRASEQIAANIARRLYRLFGILGGVFFGTALSNLLQLMNAPQIEPRQAIVTFIFGVLGSALVMIQVLRD
jgi:histone H3/H4